MSKKKQKATKTIPTTDVLVAITTLQLLTAIIELLRKVVDIIKKLME